MAYNEELAERVRRMLARRKGIAEKRMFGGLCFLLGGNMCCGIANGDLMVRVGPEQYEEALARPHARPMDFTGRPLKGMVYVSPAGLKKDEALKGWLEQGLKFAKSLPAKKA